MVIQKNKFCSEAGLVELYRTCFLFWLLEQRQHSWIMLRISVVDNDCVANECGANSKKALFNIFPMI